jgi:galactokinase
MPIEKADVVAHFTERFGQPPRWVVRAPGRVNLIGEHTDYNDGFVLPLAIDRAVWIALRPRDDRRVCVYSVDYSEVREFSLNELKSINNEKAGWIEYLKGTAWSLQDAGHRLAGWEGIMQGDVPLGAGLSSSAAVEMATARAQAAVGNLDWNPAKMAKLGQRAENKWVGVNCGIMDQLISAAGRANHALLIDCRSLETQPVPFPPGTAVVVLDTSTRRGLVDSAYNQRRSQCEAAAKFFGVSVLRDVTMEQFQQTIGGADIPVCQTCCSSSGRQECLPHLDDVTRRRALHVIGENDRTVQAAEAMRRGDAVETGRLMNESHRSLRDDFEVSSDALNAMVECASAHPACYGARMTGAGFGGCAMALIRADAAEDFVAKTAAAYEKKTGHKPAVYVCQATNGAEVV